MATYYVRTDGSNGNAGTGPATNQAWATVAYALANAALPDATNTIYIAPGTYRGSVTMSITPSVSNTLIVAGDPTAAQFTDVNAGRVRLTTFTTDNTGTPTSGQTLTCDNKTYFTLRNLHVEGYQTTTAQGIAHFSNSKNFTIEKCLFSLYRRGSQSNVVLVTTTTTTLVSGTFDKCVFIGGYYGLNILNPATGSTFDLSINVKDSFFAFNQYASSITNPSETAGVGNGVTFYNNVFINQNGCLYLRSTNTTNKTFLYNNALGSFFGIGLDVGVNAVFEDYNRFSCFTDRSGTIGGGTNSKSGVLGLDFDYSRISGLYPLDFFATYSGSPAQNTGTPTGAPTVDIFGDTWSVTNPDVGAATFKLSSATSQYYPTERNASTITIAPGSTSQSIELYLGATGLTASTSGLTARYNRTRTASVSIPLVARTIAQAYTSGGFAEVDATNMPGIYRLDVPDAALAAGADDVTIVVRGASGTNGAVMTVKLSSGGLTSAQTASAVWGASVAGYVAETDFGGVVNATRSLVGTIDTEIGDVAANVWDELRTNHTTAGSFGEYVNAELVTPVTSAALVRMGPFEVRADGIGASDPLDIQKGAQHGIDIQCVDNNGAGIDITSATVTAKVYNSGATLVDTYSCTATYAADGRAQFTIDSTVTNTPGTYTATITRTTGASDTQIFGPLRIYVRDI
jgi:hypothetical protein